MRVVGADLSFKPAMALIAEGRVAQTWQIVTRGKRDDGYPEWCDRIEGVSSSLLSKLSDWYYPDDLDLIVIEAPSHGSKFGNPHERAALWWDVYRWARHFNIPVATVAPTTRAKYITGDGRADKKKVLEEARRHWGFAAPIVNDDEADALWLADMGARFFGEPLIPDHEFYERNLQSMEVVKWPIPWIS